MTLWAMVRAFRAVLAIQSLAYWLDLPTGPSIVALLAAAFGLSYIWSAVRGE